MALPAPGKTEIERAKGILAQRHVRLFSLIHRPRLVVGLANALEARKVDATFAKLVGDVGSKYEMLLKGSRGETEKLKWKQMATRVLEAVEAKIEERPANAVPHVAKLVQSFSHPQALEAADYAILPFRARAGRRLSRIGTRVEAGKQLEYYPLIANSHGSVRPLHASLSYSEGDLKLEVHNGAIVTVELPEKEEWFTLLHPGRQAGKVQVFSRNGKKMVMVFGGHGVVVPAKSVFEIAGNRFQGKSASIKGISLTGVKGPAAGTEFEFNSPHVQIGSKVESGIRLATWK